jgi:putative methyltransferase (TIGR04325 family)
MGQARSPPANHRCCRSGPYSKIALANSLIAGVGNARDLLYKAWAAVMRLQTMKLKPVARSLVPPIAWNALRLLKGRYRKYPSWEAAAAAAGFYDDILLNRFRADRARNAPAGCLLDNALSWLIRFWPGPLSITDFGGATGGTGLALKSQNPALRYTVVETPGLVKLMEGQNEVAFTASMPPGCDIFYSSGTLQTIPDPYGILEQGFSSAARAVVLKRNYFSNIPIFRVHYSRLFDNGDGPIPDGYADRWISYPFASVDERRVMTIAGKHGFDLFSRTPESDGIGVIEDGVYGAQLVFLKA